MFIIETKTASGWRKLRDAGPFLLRLSAENYAQKYLMAGWWRVIDDTYDDSRPELDVDYFNHNRPPVTR